MTEPAIIGAKARIANPALEPLGFLIGEWRTAGTHPLVPGTILSGRASFAWHENGAFLIMRTQVDEPRFPDGIAIFGSDEPAGRIGMIYFDERGVSRIFDVSCEDGAVNWRRDDPQFSQSVTITAEGDTLVSKGRMSEKRGPWGDGLSQVYTRC